MSIRVLAMVAVMLSSSVALGQFPGDFKAALQAFGRYHGFGYGPGYHQRGATSPLKPQLHGRVHHSYGSTIPNLSTLHNQPLGPAVRGPIISDPMPYGSIADELPTAIPSR